jgi:phosphoglycolate phosphatase
VRGTAGYEFIREKVRTPVVGHCVDRSPNEWPSIPVSPPIVLLFDIDGTLLCADGAGRRALSRAFFELTGKVSAVDGVDMRGMTDPLIAEAGFKAIGLQNDPKRQARLLERYVSLLEQELLVGKGAIALPGVEDLLDWVESALPRVAVGLGTGNIEPGAHAKLRRAGLDKRFSFGGFGSDHAERHAILRAGERRGAERLGVRAGDCITFVFGDTRRDVDAARAIGAQCVAVGTGGISLDELEAAGASATVATLEDPRVRSRLWAGAGLPGDWPRG